MSVSTVLPFCYEATNTLTYINFNSEIIYSSKWYKLSAKQQAGIKLLIQYAQRDREIRGYDFLPCAIPTFLKASLISFNSYIEIY